MPAAIANKVSAPKENWSSRTSSLHFLLTLHNNFSGWSRLTKPIDALPAMAPNVPKRGWKIIYKYKFYGAYLGATIKKVTCHNHRLSTHYSNKNCLPEQFSPITLAWLRSLCSAQMRSIFPEQKTTFWKIIIAKCTGEDN